MLNTPFYRFNKYVSFQIESWLFIFIEVNATCADTDDYTFVLWKPVQSVTLRWTKHRRQAIMTDSQNLPSTVNIAGWLDDHLQGVWPWKSVAKAKVYRHGKNVNTIISPVLMGVLHSRWPVMEAQKSVITEHLQVRKYSLKRQFKTIVKHLVKSHHQFPSPPGHCPGQCSPPGQWCPSPLCPCSPTERVSPKTILGSRRCSEMLCGEILPCRKFLGHNCQWPWRASQGTVAGESMESACSPMTSLCPQDGDGGASLWDFLCCAVISDYNSRLRCSMAVAEQSWTLNQKPVFPPIPLQPALPT